MRVRLNEYVPEDDSEGKTPQPVPKHSVNPTDKFIDSVDQAAIQNMLDSCKGSPIRLAACEEFLELGGWGPPGTIAYYVDHPLHSLGSKSVKLLSLVLNTPARAIPDNWKAPFRGAAFQDAFTSYGSTHDWLDEYGGKACAKAAIYNKELVATGSADAANVRVAEFCDAVEVNMDTKDQHGESRYGGIGGDAFWLTPLLAAVRHHENGGPGRYYGIMIPGVDSYRDQAGNSAATLQKNYDRYTGKKGPDGEMPWPPPVGEWNPPVPWPHKGVQNPQDMVEFICWLSGVYAPIGVANDPNNTNIVWKEKVLWFWFRIAFCKQDTINYPAP